MESHLCIFTTKIVGNLIITFLIMMQFNLVMYEGRSINKLQNGIILLIFKI